MKEGESRVAMIETGHDSDWADLSESDSVIPVGAVLVGTLLVGALVGGALPGTPVRSISSGGLGTGPAGSVLGFGAPTGVTWPVAGLYQYTPPVATYLAAPVIDCNPLRSRALSQNGPSLTLCQKHQKNLILSTKSIENPV